LKVKTFEVGLRRLFWRIARTISETSTSSKNLCSELVALLLKKELFPLATKGQTISDKAAVDAGFHRYEGKKEILYVLPEFLCQELNVTKTQVIIELNPLAQLKICLAGKNGKATTAPVAQTGLDSVRYFCIDLMKLRASLPAK
jgi:hypothetical protein